MTVEQHSTGSARVYARNVGGIDETTVEFDPGLNVLSGLNATNRTSVLQSIMAALGSDDVTLKAAASEGEARLDTGEETYTRTLTRTDGSVRFDGTPYLEETTAADLFAFLLESNDAREAVERGDDLRSIVMEPVDTEAIDREIEHLETEKQRVDDELEALDGLEDERTELETRRAELEAELEEHRARLEEREDELESLDAEVEESRTLEQRHRDKLEELSTARGELDRTEDEIDAERRSIRALEEELRESTEELAAVEDEDVFDTDVPEIDGETDRLRSRRRELETRMSRLRNLIQFNREQLDEAPETTVLEDDTDEGEVTDELLDSETTTCWTCGSTVERTQIEATVTQLQSFRSETVDEIDGIDRRIDELVARREAYEDARRRKRQLAERIEEIEADLEQRRETVCDLESRRETLSERVDEMERTVDQLETEQNERVLELHREIGDLRSEIGQLENESERVTEKLGTVEHRLEGREELTERRSEIRDDLVDLRSRVKQIEAGFVEEFNVRMDEVLTQLGYDNIERIWIERTERTEREGRRKVTRSAFGLHVVRTTEDGTHFEDEVSNLSESEREVTGLVFALAGYLVHELYEEVPFLLIDSVEAVDTTRLKGLVEYFGDFADYTVAALLRKDAATLDDDHSIVSTF